MIDNRATACDVITHRSQYKIHFHMGQDRLPVQMCAILEPSVTALLEFLYK